MPKFMIEATYTVEGAKGLLKDGGTGRRTAVEAAVKALGGKLEAMYFTYGKYDALVLFDVPDSAAAVALALHVNAAGTSRTRTTPLVTPEEMDQATKKSVKYRAPGAAGEHHR